MDKRNRDAEGNKLTNYQCMILSEGVEVDDRCLAGSLQELGFLAKQGEGIINSAATLNENIEPRKSSHDQRVITSANGVTIVQKSQDTTDGLTQKTSLIEMTKVTNTTNHPTT